MNPTGPAAATAAPVRSATVTAAVPRVSPTRWPSPAAVSAPSCRPSSPRREEREEQARDEERRHADRDVRAAPVERPHGPEPVPVEGLHVRGQDRVHDRGQARVDRRPGERVGGGAAAGGAGRERRDRVPDDPGDQGPGDAEPHVLAHAGEPEDAHAEHDAEARPGGDAEDPRVGERVAGERLHEDPGDREPGPCEQADEGPRDALVPHDGGRDRVGPGEAVPHLGGGEVARAERERRDQDEPQQNRGRNAHSGPAAGGGGGPGQPQGGRTGRSEGDGHQPILGEANLPRPCGAPM
nr:hypothetical protein GCM10025732_44220 [Glycomyces mayteni]